MYDDARSICHDWRIVYRIRDPRSGERIDGRMAGFTKDLEAGRIHVATDTALRTGTPIELQLSVVSEDGRTGGAFRGATARGRVMGVSRNPNPEESEYLIAVSIEAIEQERKAA